MKSVTIALSALLLVACQMDKRFTRLQTGMTKEQVVAIVRKRPTGDKMQDGTEILQWEDGSHYAKFKNGRLTEYGSE